MMPFATLHTTNHPRRAHPAVTRAALCYHDRNDTESGRVAAQQRGTHWPTPCGYNRLIEVHDASNAIIATYRYDPFGRRLSKTANNQSTYYFYSAEGLIAEADANGQIIQSYGYAPGSTFTTNPLWTKLSTAGTATYYTYQNDHLGTPQKLLNQSGLTVWSATYDAFGRATVDPASTITNNLRFPGQYADQETGLHYNWMRFYDPNTGRYVTSDPIGLRGGKNFYAYAGGNSLSLIDPFGLDPGVITKILGLLPFMEGNRQHVLDDLPTAQLTAHYVGGSGENVMLPPSACDYYLKDPKIMLMMNEAMARAAAEGPNANFAYTEFNYVNKIFAMAKGYDNIFVSCQNGHCNMYIYRKDRYADPDDIAENKNDPSNAKEKYNKYGKPFDFYLGCHKQQDQCANNK